MSGETEQLARSWEANAEAWTSAVRNDAIASRRVATNAAILEAVRARKPARVLDVGCGEGWLVRALSSDGIDAQGVDSSKPLIEAARAEGGGQFEVCSYEQLIDGFGTVTGTFDAIVMNFALFEKDIGPLLRGLQSRLTSSGVLIIQTIHPWSDIGREPYRDGWRTETFDTLDGFAEPMPWYFRTLESWVGALTANGYCLDALREPAHPETHAPLSLLLVGSRSR